MSTAHDHAVLAKFGGANARSGFIAAAASESLNGSNIKCRPAHAHAKFDSPGNINSEISLIDAAAVA